MKFYRKYKKRSNLLAFIVFYWVITSYLDFLRYREFHEIVSALDSAEQSKLCGIKIDAERNWPFSWAFKTSEILIDNTEFEDIVVISRFRKSDRVVLGAEIYRYSFYFYRGKGEEERKYQMAIDLIARDEFGGLSINQCLDFIPGNEFKFDQCSRLKKVLECG